MIKKSDTLVFIPTYNEVKNITIIINQILELKIPVDILIIDDSSPDNTYEFTKNKYSNIPNFLILRRWKKLGIGSAHLDAINYAYKMNYNYLITMDADLTHQPSDINLFLKYKDDYAVVIGTRFENEESLKDWSFFRKLITKSGHLLTKFFLKLPFDATGAFRLYNLLKIPQNIINLTKSKHYDFFFESLMILNNNNFFIKEIPINLPKRTYGHSKMSYYLLFNSVLKIFYFYFKK